MKIGIVTIVDDTNFGNRLQNYATYYILTQKFRCNVTTLVAHKERPFCDGNYITWIKERIAKAICDIAPDRAENKFGTNITRWKNFCEWDRLIPAKHYYRSDNLPKRLNDQFDYFFAGSDQIWNYCFKFVNLYNNFLEFAEKNKRVAISGSFGVDVIPAEWRKKYVEGLRNFSALSVREESGQKIVKDLLGLEVPVLIDPVMMLSREEWLAVSKKTRVNCSKPYILKYYLGYEAEEEKIDIWARENGYEVYELLNKKNPELYSAGPGEFITLINKAAMICSDSFHCIAFSIIFSKPFIVYNRHGKEDYMSSRLDTLLKKFGFQNRWNNLLNEDEYMNCDYELAEKLLKLEQQKFIDYITDVLNRR